MAQEPNLPELLRAAAARVERSELRPIVRADSRDTWRSKAWARARDIVARLEREGLSRNAVARELSCDPSTVHGWLEYGNTRREQVPAWALVALEELLTETLCRPRSGTHG